MEQRFEKVWQSMKIKHKIKIFTSIASLIIFLSIFLAVWAVKYTLFDFSVILNSNSIMNDFVQCLENEADLFEAYAKTGDEACHDGLQRAIAQTQQVVGQLPFDHERIGEERYAKTWSIRNMYQVYCEKRAHVLNGGERTAEYISDLYEVYDMQDYLLDYAKQLMRDTLEDGDRIYTGKVRMIVAIPLLLISFELFFFVCIRRASELMNSSIVSPVVQLAEASRKIAENDFFIKDIEPQSEDELGELVVAFNKMKCAMGEHIMALEERRRALDLYHAEELEKIEIAARLDAMELDLLKSQINPHFLFNTLNVIGGMADLEDAHTTEAMIQSLSSLFRYNLKTPEERVTLSRELKVVRDYMFLQQMRFGDRVAYEVDCRTDMERVLIPTFIFQPLVENAIIHGLAPKENGGRILIRIRERHGRVSITVADNGIGMCPETLQRVRKDLREDNRTSIGLSNIYRRIHTMYADGKMLIRSRQGAGTIVKLYMTGERGDHFG